MNPPERRTCVIVNPRSQGGQTARDWGAIADAIRNHYGPFEHRFTERPGDGRNQARRALEEGFDFVVALGGDGTISEVASGFVDGDKPVRPQALFGILPMGTGGDFRKTVEMPNELHNAARALRGQRSGPIDLGKLDHIDNDGKPAVRYFINIASFGIGGKICQIVNQSAKRLGGKLTFLLATLRAQGEYKNQWVHLSLDGGEKQRVKIHSVAVANGRFFGGGLKIAPDAKLDDGRFDVVMLGDFSRFELLTSGLKTYRGTHVTLPKVSVARASVLEAEPVEAGEEVLLEVDGETPGRLPARFSLLPGVLRIKLPEA